MAILVGWYRFRAAIISASSRCRFSVRMSGTDGEKTSAVDPPKWTVPRMRMVGLASDAAGAFCAASGRAARMASPAADFKIFMAFPPTHYTRIGREVFRALLGGLWPLALPCSTRNGVYTGC